MSSDTKIHSNFSSFSSESQKTPTVNVPMSVINRPLPSELDEDKVQAFMKDIEKGDDFTPIEVFKCVAEDGRKYYFSMGGCHRYEAHKRLQKETIPGRVIEVPPQVIRMHLGGSSPF